MSKPSSAIYNQLNSLRGNIKTKPFVRSDSIKDPSPSPMLWKGDGVDHINIWERASTELGQLLAHNSQLHFNHNVFGRFGSMETFWHYIQSEERDDRIRSMSGQTLKNFSKKLTMARITNFRAIIMDSNWQRVKTYKDIVEAIEQSDLPFDCYYINSQSDIRVRPAFFKWFLKGFEEIRNAIKEKREPNFSFLLDNRKSTIYQFVAPSYTPTVAADIKPKHQHNKGNKPKSDGAEKPSLLAKAKAEESKVDSTEETGALASESVLLSSNSAIITPDANQYIVNGSSGNDVQAVELAG